MIPAPAVAHYKRIQRVQVSALGKVRLAWGQVDPQRISASWAEIVGGYLLPEIVTLQGEAATLGAGYGASTLAAQDSYSAPEHFVNPEAFTGTAADGRPLDSLLYAPAIATKSYLAGGATVPRALQMGLGHLDAIVKTTVTDAGRQAAGVDTAARVGVGYTRMLNPPSCKDCVVLAGKFFRWNAGFDRHPHCDCVHVEVLESRQNAAKAEGLITDPYEYFNGLSEADQNFYFGTSNAQAIRDGADINQVVNAGRGKMGKAGLTTREGTSKRGAYFQATGSRTRLTPEGIYSQNLPRAETSRLLETNGYLLPGGQIPEGAIRGQREGFGALGRGGTRVGARTAVERARATGIRDPNTRATMTEAERRRFDAQKNWEAVLEGRNPHSGRIPLTPQIAAAAENDYRQVIVYGNSMWKLTSRKGG